MTQTPYTRRPSPDSPIRGWLDVELGNVQRGIPATAALGLGLYSGSGSPEGIVKAAIGSLYTNDLGGAGTTLYVKESGAGLSTGWIPK